MADIAYLGLVVEASGDLLANTPFTFFNEVSERLKSGTTGAGIYMGVYRNDQIPGHNATLRLLASTPTLPKGIQSVVNAAQREGSALREKLNRSTATLDLGDLDDLELLPQRSASQQPAAQSGRRRARPNRRVQASNARGQLESKLNVPAAAAAAPSSTRSALRAQPAPYHAPASSPAAAAADSHHSAAPAALRGGLYEPARGSAPEVQRSSAPEAHRSSAPEAQRGSAPDYRSVQPAPRAPVIAAPVPGPELESSPDPTTELGDRSEPETYDRLVDAFLNTESESIRRRIATRLHSSRNSDHPLARFYANRAIERLVDAGAEEALENVMSTIGAQ
jgi:hypothetical protein